jgi:hypothetical protein
VFPPNPRVARRCLRARRRRKRDLAQDRKRHGEDRRIRVHERAVTTTRGNPSAALLDRRHISAETDRDARAAALCHRAAPWTSSAPPSAGYPNICADRG